MMVFKKVIPRRTFVRGAGVALALPFIDAMVPAFASAQNAASPAKRVVVAYFPNGRIMNNWTPTAEGAAFEIPPTLEPLRPFRDRLLLLSGLAHRNAEVLSPEEAGGFHPRAAGAFLTGAHPKRSEGADMHVGISVDQVIAHQFRDRTQLTSLELAVDATDVLGGCDAGYACAYSNTLSWSSPSTPIPNENRPRIVFERLFGDSESNDAASQRRRIQEDRSVLDFVNRSVNRLLTGLGAQDRVKVTEYLDAVRDLERRIQVAEQQSSRELPTIERPVGVPAKYSEHAGLMFDLLAMAFQADLTRVGTVMMGKEQGHRAYDELGISDEHHGLSHHQGSAVKIGQVARIDLFQTLVFSKFIQTLASTKEGDGSLLDHTMVLFGGGISDGNLHLHYDLPIALIAGQGTGITGGRHLRYPTRTPMTNLYVRMLDRLGIEVDKFGDSTGSLTL